MLKKWFVKDYEKKLLKKYGKNKEGLANNIKLLIITDTHNCLHYDEESLEKIKKAEYDVCLLLGDVTGGDIYEILKIVPHDKIYGLLGNHDSFDSFDEFKINNLHGKVIEVNNVKIAGIQGSHRYKQGIHVLYTHEESIEIADKLPEADILVSHDKPFLIDNKDNVHDGLKGITYYCYKNHIKVQIHGHLHDDTEDTLKNGTKVYGKYKVAVLNL